MAAEELKSESVLFSTPCFLQISIKKFGQAVIIAWSKSELSVHGECTVQCTALPVLHSAASLACFCTL